MQARVMNIHNAAMPKLSQNARKRHKTCKKLAENQGQADLAERINDLNMTWQKIRSGAATVCENGIKIKILTFGYRGSSSWRVDSLPPATQDRRAALGHDHDYLKRIRPLQLY